MLRFAVVRLNWFPGRCPNEVSILIKCRPVKCFPIKGQSMHVDSPKLFFLLEIVICGISSGAYFPMDKDSVCSDVGWCWPGPSQVVMDWQHPGLCLGLQIQSSWRRRSRGGEPRQMQVPFLHVCPAFASWVDLAYTGGVGKTPCCLCSGHLSKTGRKHWSKETSGRKGSGINWFDGQTGCVTMVEWNGQHLPSLHPPAEATEVLSRRAGGDLQWEIPSDFREKPWTPDSTFPHENGAALTQHPRQAVGIPPLGFWETCSRFEADLAWGRRLGQGPQEVPACRTGFKWGSTSSPSPPELPTNHWGGVGWKSGGRGRKAVL